MKKISIRFRLARHDSFTLVELLVVIGIIAILAGVALSAGMAALRAAQRAKAFNLASTLQSACIAYYSEYSTYPMPPQTTASDYTISDANVDSLGNSSTAWQALISPLSGNLNPYDGTTYTPTTITNARGIPFLSLKQSDVDLHNAPKNPIYNAAIAGPYFNIAMDGNYDGVVGASSSGSGNVVIPEFSPNFNATKGGTTTSGVAVWANCNTTSVTNAAFYVHTY